MRFRPLGIGEGNALGDQPARTRGNSGGDKMGGTFDAQASVARQHLFAPRRIEEAREVGQLMEEDFGPRTNDGIA